jgi:glycine betaine/proline transport system permease protein
LGRVPGVLATVIFAMPPVVRLTSLGHPAGPQGAGRGRHHLRLHAAGRCWSKVEIPGALPSIMAGINQTIMMALSMVIIASMVGAGGLGNDVLASIQRLDIGLGFESGLAVVLLAIMLDRITETFGAQGPRRSCVSGWAWPRASSNSDSIRPLPATMTDRSKAPRRPERPPRAASCSSRCPTTR